MKCLLTAVRRDVRQCLGHSKLFLVWDENGLRKGEKEPKKIRQIHSEMVEFVKAWLEDWGRPLL
ncbi:hypothetical protein BGW80DRAFT_675370 [Lactifluus volemus]|nr:hypothetical protein BGW80DRAFT_675370 [Lactifluus volemus]